MSESKSNSSTSIGCAIPLFSIGVFWYVLWRVGFWWALWCAITWPFWAGVKVAEMLGLAK